MCLLGSLGWRGSGMSAQRCSVLGKAVKEEISFQRGRKACLYFIARRSYFEGDVLFLLESM